MGGGAGGEARGWATVGEETSDLIAGGEASLSVIGLVSCLTPAPCRNRPLGGAEFS